jgi:hypothetical protein
MKFCTMHFYPLSFYFLLLNPNIFLHALLSDTRSLFCSPDETHIVNTAGKIILLYTSSFIFVVAKTKKFPDRVTASILFLSFFMHAVLIFNVLSKYLIFAIFSDAFQLFLRCNFDDVTFCRIKSRLLYQISILTS